MHSINTSIWFLLFKFGVSNQKTEIEENLESKRRLFDEFKVNQLKSLFVKAFGVGFLLTQRSGLNNFKPINCVIRLSTEKVYQLRVLISTTQMNSKKEDPGCKKEAFGRESTQKSFHQTIQHQE